MNLFEQGVRNLVQKAQSAARAMIGRNGSLGSMSDWVANTNHGWGQTNVDAKVSVERMREIVMKTPTAAAALNTILDYAANVDIYPTNVDHSQKVPARAEKFIRDLLDRPNGDDTGRHVRYKVLRDLVTLGQGFIEIERDKNGNVANIYALDPARLLVDFDENGLIRGYNQRNHSGNFVLGRDGVHTWPADDVIWFRLDTKTDSQYPTSRIEQLFAAAVLESLMLAFIGGRFTDGNVPFGLFDMGDVTQSEVEDAIELWNQQVTDKKHPEHRIIFTGTKGSKWYPFGYHLKDLEAPELLGRVRLEILSILGVTVNELGESDSVNKANGYNLTFTFKKRAIEPLLKEFTETLSRRLLHDELSFKDTELNFADIDSRDELLQSQIDKIRLDNGVVSINQVRNRDGAPSIEGGDEPAVNLGASVIPISMVKKFADAQLQALEVINKQAEVVIMQSIMAMQLMQQEAQQAQQAIDPATGQPIPGVAPAAPLKLPEPLQMLGTLPMVRGMQPPDKFTTPDAHGSSTAKFKMPQPKLAAPKNPKPTPAQPAAPSTGQPQAPRGPVQTLRNAGLRKEDTHGAK